MFYLSGNVEGTLIGYSINLNHCCCFVLEAREKIDIFKPVTKGRNLPQSYFAAIGVCNDGDIGKFVGVVQAPFCADQYLATFRLDASCGKVETCLPDGIGYPAKGQAIATQCILGDFNMDFPITDTQDVG